MKFSAGMILLALAVTGTTAWAQQDIRRAPVPGPADTQAYRPVPAQKPLPPPGFVPGLPPQGQPMPGPAAGGAPQGQPAVAPQELPNEANFIKGYMAQRRPRIMIFVNRTMAGDATAKAGDASGVTADDYEMIESSLVRYFDNSGKITICDSDAARAKLNHEQILRLENGDAATARILSTELQQDILIRVTASPTKEATSGHPSLRLVAKAVSTTDARMMGESFVDMPLPVGKTAVNVFTGYLADELMGDMSQKWAQTAAENSIEVRIYKAAGLDDTLAIKKWLKATQGVAEVQQHEATAVAGSAYSTLSVAYQGAPEDLYASLKDAIGSSQGIKAVEVESNRIDLEVTGPMNLVTTTRHTETKTVTETKTTDDRRIEPINPAPAPAPVPVPAPAPENVPAPVPPPGQ